MIEYKMRMAIHASQRVFQSALGLMMKRGITGVTPGIRNCGGASAERSERERRQRRLSGPNDCAPMRAPLRTPPTLSLAPLMIVSLHAMVVSLQRLLRLLLLLLLLRSI